MSHGAIERRHGPWAESILSGGPVGNHLAQAGPKTRQARVNRAWVIVPGSTSGRCRDHWGVVALPIRLPVVVVDDPALCTLLAQQTRKVKYAAVTRIGPRFGLIRPPRRAPAQWVVAGSITLPSVGDGCTRAQQIPHKTPVLRGKINSGKPTRPRRIYSAKLSNFEPEKHSSPAGCPVGRGRPGVKFTARPLASAEKQLRGIWKFAHLPFMGSPSGRTGRKRAFRRASL